MNTNPLAKRILIYGDSLIWGRVAGEFARHDASTRYTGVLQNELGNDYEVIEEGLRSRMAKGENPHLRDRDGFKQFPAIFSSHLPVDILVIFLGTNDTNYEANKTPEAIVSDLESYIDLAKESAEIMGMEPPSSIVYVAVPRINEGVLKENSMFKGAEEKTISLPPLIEEMCKRNGFHYFDPSSIAEASSIDGVHLDEENNEKLGKALAEFIREVD